jgi:endoglycosylceramidase
MRIAISRGYLRTLFSWMRIACIVIVALLFVTAPAWARDSTLLAHDGRWITDVHGRVVIPHGVAVMNFQPPNTPEAAGFGDADAALLAEHGFDVVRVGMNWSGLEPEPGIYSTAYLDSIQRTVQTLARHGIYSLLDMHQDGYGPLTGTDGAPDWATISEGLPNENAGFGPDYFVNPALERAFDNLWADTNGVADQFGGALARLGARFSRQPYVLGYDLFNEPWPGSQYASCMSPAGCPLFDSQLSAFYRRVIGDLRTTDRRHMSFAEPNLFFDFGSNTNLSSPGSQGFAFHDYCLGAGAGDALPDVPNNGPACSEEETTTLNNAVAYGEASGSALINTEWAATDDLDNTARVADELDAARMPWTFWQYGTRSKAAMSIIDRPYPRAVAGVPEAWKWDAQARTFTLTYTPGSGRTTEVWTSPMHYPAGYDAKVTGGRIVSAANAAVLQLRAERGSREIRLELTPRGTS